MPEIIIIGNPHAGGGRGFDAIASRAAEDPKLSLLATRDGGEARRLATEAAEGGARIVVAAGGDGTIHEVARGLVEADGDVALGVIPLGTGNDLARSLGIPDEVEDALAIVLAGRERSMDLVDVAFAGGERDLCVNAAAGGFSGRIHDALDEDVKRFWGPLSYLRGAVGAIGDTEPWDVRLTIDGREMAVRALNVVVANGRFAGRGIPIAPHADPFDGMLDVAVVKDATMLQLSRLAPALLRGEDPEDEHFFTARGRSVVLEVEPEMPFSVDGERSDRRGARFTVLPARLRVVVP